MKSTISLCLLLCSTLISSGQRTVIFDNFHARVLLAPVGSLGGFSTPGGYAPTGTAWRAQLYSTSPDGDQYSFRSAGDPVPFRTGNNGGFVETRDTQINPFTGQPINPEVAVVLTPGATALLQMRVWDAQYPTYEEAALDIGAHAKSTSWLQSKTGIGGQGGTPGEPLTGLPSFSIPAGIVISSLYPFILQPGWNLVGNVFPLTNNFIYLFWLNPPPEGTRVFRYTTSGWAFSTFARNDNGFPEWEGSAGGNLKPGEGFFVYLPGANEYRGNVYLEPVTARATIALSAGMHLLTMPLLRENTLPNSEGSSLFRFNRATHSYNRTDVVWQDLQPFEGYWYFTPEPVTWRWD